MATQLSDTNRRTIVIEASDSDMLNLLTDRAKAAGLLPAEVNPTSVQITGGDGVPYNITFIQDA